MEQPQDVDSVRSCHPHDQQGRRADTMPCPSPHCPPQGPCWPPVPEAAIRSLLLGADPSGAPASGLRPTQQLELPLKSRWGHSPYA